MFPIALFGVAMAASSAPQTVGPLQWRVVNDTVMGGVSTGQLAEIEDGQRFTGELSLESNGGFVSVRSVPAPLKLDDVSALRVTVRGDGRTWSVNAYREDIPLRAGSYRADLPTEKGQITTITVPLADFSATSYGRPVWQAPALDANPGAITQLGFLLADKNPGPYQLDILSVEAVDGRRAPTRDGSVQKALSAAIEQGVPAFNAGDHERCQTLYATALAELPAESLTDGEQVRIQATLARAERLSATDAAWALRYTMDALLMAR